MLGLPSTTEVDEALPKASFYRNMSLDAKTRQQVVSGVERIVVKNVMRPDTTNLADGLDVHEVFVIVVEPKGEVVPKAVVATILKATDARALVVDGLTGHIWAKGPNGTLETEGTDNLVITGANLDEAWDSVLSQLAFGGETDGTDVATRIARKDEVEALEHEVAALDRKCRRERQLTRRNALFAQLAEKRARLAALKGE